MAAKAAMLRAHADLQSMEDDIVWEPMAADEQVKPFVHHGRGWKSLHFSISAIQSRMRTGQPEALDLEYTRLMMGFVWLVRAPRRLAMIGLGGGSMVKFMHRHLAEASLDVVEINRHVVALRDEFGVPPDDERLCVTTADGAAFVEQAQPGTYDVLLVDAFDEHGMPPPLSTPRFYDACRRLLTPRGVFVVNLQSGDPLCGVHVDRIATAFDGNLLRVDAGDHSNSVVFAGNEAPLRLVRPSCPLVGDAWTSLAHDFARIHRSLASKDVA
ncbi:MAG: Spermidine synthase-like [Rhizobacter sp.]|nr:Spermidine synthase-like [Rhizobacter sp.]